MRGEGQVGVPAAQVDDAQRAPVRADALERPAGGRDSCRQEGVDLPALVGVRAQGGEQRVARVEQVLLGAVVRDPLSWPDVPWLAGLPVDLRLAALGHAELDHLVAGLDVPVSERLGEQGVDRALRVLARGVVRRADRRDGRTPVGRRDLEPQAGLEPHGAQLHPRERGLRAASPSGSDGPDQALRGGK